MQILWSVDNILVIVTFQEITGKRAQGFRLEKDCGYRGLFCQKGGRRKLLQMIKMNRDCKAFQKT